MLTILQSRNFWIFSVFTGLFFIFAPLFQRSYVFDVANSFSIAGVVGVMVMYYASVAKKTGSWAWIFYNNLSGAHYFIIGLLGFCIYIAVRHTYNAVWRWNGKPDIMLDHLFVAYLISLTALIAAMHLLSRDLTDGRIPLENWRWVGICVAIALALAGVTIAFLDPSPPVAGGGLR